MEDVLLSENVQNYMEQLSFKCESIHSTGFCFCFLRKRILYQNK